MAQPRRTTATVQFLSLTFWYAKVLLNKMLQSNVPRSTCSQFRISSSKRSFCDYLNPIIPQFFRYIKKIGLCRNSRDQKKTGNEIVSHFLTSQQYMTLALWCGPVMESMTSRGEWLCNVGLSKNFHCKTYVAQWAVTCEPCQQIIRPLLSQAKMFGEIW